MKGVRGQVTSFIVVGVMILLIAAIVFFLRQERVEDVDVLDYTPEDLGPVESYLVSCLENSAKDALLRIGMQGGYIDLPEQIYTNPRTYIQPSPGSMKTPLWRVGGSDIYPDINLVQEQLEEYVEKDIVTCVEALKELDFIGYVDIKSLPKVKASINQGDVSFILDYEFEAEFENKFITYDKFGVRLPVKLYDMLKTSAYLLQKNNEEMYLGYTTVTLLAMDPDIPLGDMKLDCQRLRWSKTEVKKKIQDYLTFMMPSVRVSGTDYMAFEEPLKVYQEFDKEWDFDRFEKEGRPDNLPDDMYQYLHLFWQMDYDFNGLNVGFSYMPEYGMNMQVSPSDGDKIEAEAGRSGSQYLQYLCFNVYHFTYDISYPLKVTLYDSSAFDGEGFQFSFGLPIFVEKNIPKTQTPSFFMMDAYETDEFFCSESNENVVITATDYFTGEYLSEIDVTYDCIRYYCDLGTVSSDSNYGIPALYSGLPSACYNGFFIAEKPGYLRVKSQIPTDNGAAELVMLPIKDFDFGLFQLANGIPVPYRDTYRASIYLKAQNHDFEGFYTVPTAPGQTNTLHLLDGPEVYDLEIYLYNYDKLVGGYIGDFEVSSDDLNSGGVSFYAYERPNMGSGATAQQLLDLYSYLDEDSFTDPYRQKYYPEFR